MKRFSLLLSAVILAALQAFSQSPASIPYQAVARNSAGNLLVNQAVSLRFTIHQTTGSGTSQYQETQSATTNNLGLFSVNVGAGTVVSGTFAGITWSDGQPKFIQVEIDPTGGTSYTNMGATQMMSVPYALYAGSASTVPSSNLTESTSDVLTITGGSNSVVSAAGTTIQVKKATASQDGYLSSADWSTFNGKQAALTFTQPLSNSSNTVSIGYDNSTIKMNGSNQLYAVNTGTITGSGAANQMTYFSSSSNITSSGTATFTPNNSGAAALAVTNSSATTSSEAVSGSATGNGIVYGVYGASSSTTSGAGGVYGNETGTSGVVYGVGGIIASTTAAAAGVLGDALGTTGATYGVYGLNASATAGSAGVYGSSTGGNGYGIYGTSTGSGTNNIAAYFSASGGTNNYSIIVPSTGGNVGIGTTAPTSKLTVGPALTGTDLSSTFVSNAGTLGTTSGNSLILGNFGFVSGNSSSLGIHALRTASGTDWTTTALGLLYDVDNTSPVNNAQIWLTSAGDVGIGTTSPSYNLDVNGSFRVLATSSALTESGGSTSTNGGYTVVAFTSSGTFTPSGPMTVDVLVVGGGGGGGGNGGGGGGAGGVVENASYVVTGPVTVTIGTGGAGSVNTSSDGSNGNASSFGDIIAYGGGGGASRASGEAALGLVAGSVGNANSTGSGGGGGGCSSSSACTGGYGTSGQGNNGGTGYSNSTCTASGAGGGGAGGVGGNGGVSAGGAGGAGAQYANFSTGGGSPAGWFGGGGGGGAVCYNNPSTAGAASNGGGGAGSNGTATAGSAGIANTGGGGGGGGTGTNGSAGGSGIVILRYQTSTAVTDPTVIATSGSYVGIGTSSPTSTLQVVGNFQTTTMHLVTYSNSLTSSGHFQVTVSCGNGGTLVSGGCYDNDDDITGETGNTALEMSYPQNSSTWRCGSRDISTLTTRTLTAYAICTQ